MQESSQPRWRLDGVRVVHAGELDINTAQTPGMNRAAAITHARAGAEKLWAGTVVIHPMAKTGAHHHGPVESVIYVVSGRARMRWGERLEFVAEAGPGDFGKYDCIVIVTDHKSFDYAAMVAEADLIVDTRNAIKKPAARNVFRLGAPRPEGEAVEAAAR